MSEIKKCENCGNENIEIINLYKGHYLCGKCGRDTEKLYEIEHDAEIREKAIEEFANRLYSKIKAEIDDCADELDWIEEIAEQMKGSEEHGQID